MMCPPATFAKALLAVLAAAALPAQEAAEKARGSVKGTFTTTEKVRTRGSRSQAEFLVYLVPKQKVDLSGRSDTADVRQKRLQFSPRVLPVVVGTEVTFHNDDKVTHNVYIESECCRIDEDAAHGDKVVRTFPQKGEFAVVCRLHPEMTMTVVALETPWFTSGRLEKQKGDDGETRYVATFEIRDVPPGKYELRTWNKKFEPIVREIEVVAAEATTVELRPER